MATFTGSASDDLITPTAVSAPVITDGALRPSTAADTLNGGAGADTLDGGGGDDLINGGTGDDSLSGSAGADLFQVGANEGRDTIDGGGGVDTLQFNLSAKTDAINIAAQNGHAVVTDTDPLTATATTVDLVNVERLSFGGGGGTLADNIKIDSLAGTSVTQVDIDLAGDTGKDFINVVSDQTTGQRIVLSTVNGVTSVNTPVNVNISHADLDDRLGILAGAGDDTLDASALGNNAIGVKFFGSAGTDTLAVNGGGADDTIVVRESASPFSSADANASFVVNGVGGNNIELNNVEIISVATGGGNDTIDARAVSGGAAALKVDGGSGSDSALFNLSTRADAIDIAAQNGHAVVTDTDPLTATATTVDLVNVERLSFGGGGGTLADNIKINSLAGTSVTRIDIDLAGDTGKDVVNVVSDPTIGQRIVLSTVNGVTSVNTPVNVNISHADLDDRLGILAGAGDDTLDASALGNNAIGVKFFGSAGTDTLAVNGSSADDTIRIVAQSNSSSVGLLVNGVGNNVELSQVEIIALGGGAGNDQIDATALGAGVAALKVDGGDGADTLTGSQGLDTLNGGAGDDVINSGTGNEVLLGGGGGDTFVFNPGDGADTIDGGDGSDTLRFTGPIGGPNAVSLTSSNGHVILASAQNNALQPQLDLVNLETVNVLTGGTTDSVSVADLTGTNLKQVNVDLGINGGVDNLADTIVVTGSLADDHIVASTVKGVTTVSGLNTGANVSVSNADNLDRLVINGGAGDDQLDISNASGGVGTHFDGGAGVNTLVFNGAASPEEIDLVNDGRTSSDGDLLTVIVNGATNNAAIVNVQTASFSGGGSDDLIDASRLLLHTTGLSLSGGDGNDSITGSQGLDTINGGAGDDVINSGTGNEVLQGGAGNDTFVYNPGDRADTIDGGTGSDNLLFTGANAAANAISLNGFNGHVILASAQNNAAQPQLDLVNVETVNIVTRGNTDSVFVGDLTGTVAKQVNIDLGVNGSVDNLADTILAGFASTADHIVATTVNNVTTVSGLSIGANVSVSNADNLDRFVINGGAGDDQLDISNASGGVGTHFDGGAGVNTLVFNGSASPEEIDLINDGRTSPTDGDLLTVIVNGATNDAAIVNVQAASFSGGGSDDVIDASRLLLHQVSLSLSGGDGNDSITGSQGLDTVNGGAGDDVITSGTGNEVLLGGGGNDTIAYNPGGGADTIDGGAGSDTLQFNGSGNLANAVLLTSANGHVILADAQNNAFQPQLDLNNVETLNIVNGANSDSVVVGDLTGTTVKQVSIDLGINGGVDSVRDTAILTGRASADHVFVADVGGTVVVTGLAAGVTISNVNSQDQLQVGTGAGNDTFDASATAGRLNLSVSGGDGNDSLIGSNHADTLTGDAGADTIAGAGGGDILAGGAGNDRFVFASTSASNDQILDFQAHGTSTQGDLIVLNGFADLHSFSDLVAQGDIVQSGANVVISDAGVIVVTLQNVTLGSLHANDFLFGS